MAYKKLSFLFPLHRTTEADIDAVLSIYDTCTYKHIRDVVVSVLVSSAVDRGSWEIESKSSDGRKII
jgi:hypothetical protein